MYSRTCFPKRIVKVDDIPGSPTAHTRMPGNVIQKIIHLRYISKALRIIETSKGRRHDGQRSGSLCARYCCRCLLPAASLQHNFTGTRRSSILYSLALLAGKTGCDLDFFGKSLTSSCHSSESQTDGRAALSTPRLFKGGSAAPSTPRLFIGSCLFSDGVICRVNLLLNLFIGSCLFSRGISCRVNLL